MKTNRLHHYLRGHRKKLGFTQQEIAFLLGYNQTSNVSRCEKRYLTPHFTTVIAYEVVLQTPARELFAGLFETISRDIKRRARVMLSEIDQESNDPKIKRKVEHLRQVVKGD